MVKPVILQIVGYQNSGKTTFVSNLIETLKQEELNTVTIKHHGSGGKPGVVDYKDSSKHIESGASASLVEGDGRILLQAERPSWTVEEKIQLLRFFEPDVILIEGFKREKYPKLLFIKDHTDKELLTKLSNVKAVVIWDKGFQRDLAGEIEIPCYHIDDKNSLNWIIEYLKSHLFDENS